MVRASLRRVRTAFVSALGLTILLGTPLFAQADQGKWWKPKEGDRASQRQDRGWQQRDRGRGDRGSWRGSRGRGDQGGAQQGDRARDRGSWRGRENRGPSGPADRDRVVRERTYRGGVWRDRQTRDRVTVRDRRVGGTYGGGGVTYRDRRVSGGVTWGGRSTWRGVPIRRDVLTIRDRRYGGGYFRARRTYCAPRYWGRFVYVRPVRYFIAADAFIGGIGIRARIVRPHYLYGCNFCEDQFDSYDAYSFHVAHCDHRPVGLEISCSDWDDSGYDSSWDGPYRADDEYYDDQDQGYDEDDTYYDQ